MLLLCLTCYFAHYFKASKALGNYKPPLLAEIERELWLALLSIANGEKSASFALDEFFSKFPSVDFEHLSQSDKLFFANGIFRCSCAIFSFSYPR